MQIWLFMKEKSKGALLPKEYNILLSPDFVIKRWLFRFYIYGNVVTRHF